MNRLNPSQFAQAFLRPQQTPTPTAFQAYARDGGGRELWLVINPKTQKLSECFYRVPEGDIWTPYFELLTPLLKGLSPEQAMGLSWHQLHSALAEEQASSKEESTVVQVFRQKFSQGNLPMSFLPGDLVRRALGHFLGLDQIPVPWESTYEEGKSAANHEQLVCRCFGVSNRRLETFFQSHPDATLAQVNGELRAGAGCGTCHDDIELMSARYCDRPVEIHVNQGRHIGPCEGIGGHDPVEVAQLVDQYLKEHWPFVWIERCAGRRLELSAPEAKVGELEAALGQLQSELSELLGSTPYLICAARD